jgi:PAS domain S-box-containing protein
MGPDQNISRTIFAGRSLCLVGAGFGAIVVLGWLTGTRALVTMAPGQPEVLPNTAVALLLLGLAGALRPSRWAALFSVPASLMVLALGLVRIAGYPVNLPFSIERAVLPIQGELPNAPPSPTVAIVLVLISAAILASKLPTPKRIHPSEWLILCAGLIAFIFAVVQLFSTGGVYGLPGTPIAGVPLPAAISLILISAGLLVRNPHSGIIRFANSAAPGGIMLRRLIPAVILIALPLGFAASWLTEIVGRDDVVFVRAGATLLGIILVLPLFAITARHLNRVHEELERSQARYRELVQLASDGIFVADLEGRFTEVNDAGCRLLGFSREEILGKTIMDFILPEEKERLFRDRERFLKGASDVSEWMLLKKDGTYVPVEVSAKILPDRRWIAIDRDISERKRAESALRLSEAAAKQASQARDDILGIVAHDLRNPLSTIMTLAAVLQKGQEREIGDEIAHASKRMTRLIRDLIDVTLLNAGRFTIKQERIRSGGVLSEVFASQALLASSASLRLHIDAAQNVPEIWADNDRILQVFENLVGNAIKFTEPGGHIVLGARARDGEVLFWVADTGCGIANDQLPHVFDRFWQGSDGKRGGVGLGLPITKGIVEAHGGRVWARSALGQGSIFFFTVPTAQVEEHPFGKTDDVGLSREKRPERMPDSTSVHVMGIATGNPAETRGE